VLLAYNYGDYLKEVKVPFRKYTHNNGTGHVSAQELQKLVYQRLLSSSKIISVKQDNLEFYYNYGTKKQVPVRWSGRVIPDELFFISRVHYSPDSVTIYAADDKLDSISIIYTEPLNYANFRDTLRIDCRLTKMKGVKMVPDHVRVTFFTDVLTEERIDGIPVQGINMPEGKILRTFPSKASVTFVTGINTYRNLTPNDFTIVADYNEIKQNPTEKCRISLKDVPHGISRVRIETPLVDYLIESENE
jgi:YbbR domain-containing protein